MEFPAEIYLPETAPITLLGVYQGITHAILLNGQDAPYSTNIKSTNIPIKQKLKQDRKIKQMNSARVRKTN